MIKTCKETERDTNNLETSIPDPKERYNFCVRHGQQGMLQMLEKGHTHWFEAIEEEIDFFKNKLPRIKANMIFNYEYLKLFIYRPQGTVSEQEDHFKAHKERIKGYILSRKQFREQCEQNDAAFDKQHFTRDAYSPGQVVQEPYHFFNMIGLSAPGDIVVATLMALERILPLIDKELAVLCGEHPTGDTEPNPKKHAPVNWTGSHTDLVEVLTGLFEAGLINHGEGHFTEAAHPIAEFLGVKLGNISKLQANLWERGIGPLKAIKDMTEGVLRRFNLREAKK